MIECGSRLEAVCFGSGGVWHIIKAPLLSSAMMDNKHKAVDQEENGY